MNKTDIIRAFNTCGFSVNENTEDAYCLADIIRNAALEEAAQFMLSRKIMASEFYAAAIRKMKNFG